MPIQTNHISYVARIVEVANIEKTLEEALNESRGGLYYFPREGLKGFPIAKSTFSPHHTVQEYLRDSEGKQEDLSSTPQPVKVSFYSG